TRFSRDWSSDVCSSDLAFTVWLIAECVSSNESASWRIVMGPRRAKRMSGMANLGRTPGRPRSSYSREISTSKAAIRTRNGRQRLCSEGSDTAGKCNSTYISAVSICASTLAAVVTTLLSAIGSLVTNDPAHGDGSRLGEIKNAAMVIDSGGRVVWVGEATRAPAADMFVDVGGRCVIPGFVDSHAHLVFAGERSAEFAARMSGEPYRAGGIRTTVQHTRAATDESLALNLASLIAEMHRQGTTTVEVKSGYGLTVRDESRALMLAGQHTDETTFLGAHVVPSEFEQDPVAYVDLVTGPMLEACAAHARWIDVFCESGAFDADASRAVLTAGIEQGLGARVHANQLGPGPGVQLACELGAASADHCTHLD